MKSNYKRLGDYIEPCDEKNTGNFIKKLQGISNQKYFQKAKTNTIGVDLEKYRIVRNGQFAFNRATTRNGDKISIALRQGKDCIVSPSYRIFRSKDENILNSEYLMMWFKRPEFDRFARFKSHGSAHEFFDYGEMCEVELPIPSIEKQREIVREYNVIQNRIALNNQLISKHEETAQAIYKQWFVNEVDIENLPKGWRIGRLEEMTDLINAGVIPKYTEESIDLVLGQRCVHDNYIDLKFARQHIPKDNCLLVKFGDILINSTGGGTLGRVGQVYFEPNRLAFDSNMTLVRASKDCYIDYLGCLLSQKESYFIQISQGSTNQTRLYCSMVSPVVILIPEDKILEEFKNKVRKIKINQQRLRKDVLLSNSLKDLLLAKMTKVETEKELVKNIC